MNKRRTQAKVESQPENSIHNPELFFGLVGPIGVDIETVVEALARTLKEVDYDAEPVHLTQHMENSQIKSHIENVSYHKRYMSLIKYANEFRKIAGSPAAMAGLAVLTIRKIRSNHTSSETLPSLGTGYIIRQFKRPEEIAAMRRIYGRKFVQVSVYGSPLDRRKVLMEKIASFDASPKTDADRERQAIELIETDANQADEENGQRLADVFHLGDVFVDGIDREKAETTLRRFIRAFFGNNAASLTIEEFGLYTASAAALRSVDLSRQVGSAIFTPSGDIISMGCNEVPKPGGGNYWADSGETLSRDIERGNDANQARKAEIVFDLVERLGRSQMLASELAALASVPERVAAVMSKTAVRDAQIMDIIEFGRMIHAEMSALTDAARLGRSTKDATLYCTTYPCHLCAKHIVAAGIMRVVFLEPYPKSAAQKLHDDSITSERTDAKKVLFEPFMGISPRRYREIFEKKRRKGSDGRALDWYEKVPVPLVEDKSAAYIENEESEVFLALPNFLRGRGKKPKPAGPK
ncbi:deoxycytidylate deaminase [Methylocystis sp. MitZ-2018]|nr:deoxycytidylate deaminase [Methylocystis sp. MitZ-2018]